MNGHMYPLFLDRVNLLSCKSFTVDRIGLDGTMYIMYTIASYGKYTHTCKFESTLSESCSFSYLANWSLYIPQNGFQSNIIKVPRLWSRLLCICCPKKKTAKMRICVLSIVQLCAWAHWLSAYVHLSPPFVCSTLYVTTNVVINISFHGNGILHIITSFPWGNVVVW